MIVDWARYKSLCDRPDYWSRWMLEQCIELFRQLDEDGLSSHLEQTLRQLPLDTPGDHHGHPATHMFRLDLSVPQRRIALSTVQQAIDLGIRTRNTAERGLGGFAEAWREYLEYQV